MADTASPNLASSLKKQIGPLPLGVWIALVVGGVGVTWYLNRGRGGTLTAQVPSEVVDQGDGTYGTVGAAAGTAPTAPPATITTNDEWAAAAIRYLIGKGYNPTAADTAIRKYIAAGQLTVQENALVADALARLGPPPSALAPAPDPEAPGAEPTAPPAMPQGLRVQDWSRDGINVNITWEPVAGAKTYRIYLAGGLDVFRFVAETTGTFYVVRVGRGAPWKYGVSAVNAKGESVKAPLIFDNSKG